MASNSNDKDHEDGEPFPWHVGIFDAHCHPTDSMSALDQIPAMKAKVLTIMATWEQDQDLVSQTAEKFSTSMEALCSKDGESSHTCSVIPSFGWHPWFSHQIYDDTHEVSSTIPITRRTAHYKAVLTPPPEEASFIDALPDPRPLSRLIDQLRAFLVKFPLALVGEVGLDRSFRIPEPQASILEQGLTAGGREARRLSPYRVNMSHQRTLLRAQLHLAGEMRRAVSVHGVAAHGVLFEALQETWKGHERKIVSKRARKKGGSISAAEDFDSATPEQIELLEAAKTYPPRICLHSYSGPADQVKQYLNPAIPAVVFFSFSQVINFSSPASAKTVESIRVVPNDRILIESDLHLAGGGMDGLLEEIVRLVCCIKGWRLCEGAEQLARNWRHFVLDVK